MILMWLYWGTTVLEEADNRQASVTCPRLLWIQGGPNEVSRLEKLIFGDPFRNVQGWFCA